MACPGNNFTECIAAMCCCCCVSHEEGVGAASEGATVSSTPRRGGEGEIDYMRLNADLQTLSDEMVDRYMLTDLFVPTLSSAIDKQILRVSMRHSLGLIASQSMLYILPTYTTCPSSS